MERWWDCLKIWNPNSSGFSKFDCSARVDIEGGLYDPYEVGTLRNRLPGKGVFFFQITGRSWFAGPKHSKTFQNWLVHIPHFAIISADTLFLHISTYTTSRSAQGGGGSFILQVRFFVEANPYSSRYISKADPVWLSFRTGQRPVRHFVLLKGDAVSFLRQVNVELWGSRFGARRSSGVESVHTSARAQKPCGKFAEHRWTDSNLSLQSCINDHLVGDWNIFYFPIYIENVIIPIAYILRMSLSQLTNSNLFQRGRVETNPQPVINVLECSVSCGDLWRFLVPTPAFRGWKWLWANLGFLGSLGPAASEISEFLFRGQRSWLISRTRWSSG